MTNYLTIDGKENRNLVIPNDFVTVSHDKRQRNGEPVTVVRYQKKGPVTPNNPHVTIVLGDNQRLLSYNNFSFETPGKLPSSKQAVNLATQVFQSIDSVYASGLSFMRIDNETRTFINDDGNLITKPIMWVNFAPNNGSYNWVSIGPNAEIVEVERESLWDFGQWRRGTEEWNIDDWVLAREGKGPQLKAPSALA